VLLIVASLLAFYAIYQVLCTPLFYKLLGEEILARENLPIVVEKYLGTSDSLAVNGTAPNPTNSNSINVPLTSAAWEKRLQYWNNAANRDKTPRLLTDKFLTWTPWDAGLNNR
jgi:hypothetical protein